MGQLVKQDSWVWVIVQDPAGNAQFVGQQDEKTQFKFIPVFLEKETALKNMNALAREKGHKYEAQAIIFEELVRDAKANGFEIIFLDDDGKVLEQIKA